MSTLTSERLRGALAGAEPAWRELLRDALSSAPAHMGESGLEPGRWEGWSFEAERIVAQAAGHAHAERLRCAALARCAAARMYPPAAEPSGAAHLARWLAHAAGCPADTVESAASLARHVHLAVSDAPRDLLREASLEVDTRELAALATMIAPSADLIRFREACQQADCWGRRVAPPHLPQGARGRIRRALLRATIEGLCETEEDVQSLLHVIPKGSGGVLIAAVGIPGSGKTTFLDRHFGDVLTVSMDRMRAAFLGDTSDQSRNELIHRQSMTALAHALERGRRVLFDATSTTRERREPFLSIARRTGAEVLLVFFDVSLDEAFRRNASRTRKVPAGVVQEGYRHLEPPRPDEADAALIVSPPWSQPRLFLFDRDQWLWEAQPISDIRSVVERSDRGPG